MKRVLVDMDGVLADVYTRFFDLQEAETEIRPSVKDVAGKLEAEAFPNQVKWVSAPGFFRDIPIMPDSQRILKKLNKVYEVIVISMATEFPLSLTDKQLWMQDHFPFITWRQLVFCGDKSILKADIMIDDHFKNLDNFKGDTLLFSQPHNMLSTNKQHKRVDSWEEINRILKDQKA